MAAEAHNMNLNDLGSPNSPKNSAHQQPSASKSKIKSFFSYSLLPGIMPQIRYLTRGGFGYLAFLIALVYQSVRILPNNHPYGRYDNIGTYGLRDVIAAAANRIKFTKQNIDQIIVFFAIIAGLIIMALQILSFLLFLLTGQAFAQEITPDSFGGIFNTANPDTDIAFFMMREIFGLPEMFGTLEGGPTNLHLALHTMIEFYNLAILVVAIIIFIYYVIVVVAETAQTGVPFGQRFSHIYALLRLVIAIGLLVPLNNGYNGAQYITFYAAKAGSGFATTGWSEFNNSLNSSNPLGAENATLIAQSKVPNIESLVEFMATAVTCREAYDLEADAYNKINAMVRFGEGGIGYLPFITSTLTTLETENWHQPIEIIFGKYKDTSPGASSVGNEFLPVCGKVIIPTNFPLTVSAEDEFDQAQLQKEYYNVVSFMWGSGKLKELGQYYAQRYRLADYDECVEKGTCDPPPVAAEKQEFLADVKATIDTLVLSYYEAAREGVNTKIKEETLLRGWGGAGIWYNRIAEINGAYVVATRNLPEVKNFPVVMEKVLEEKQRSDNKFSSCESFEPKLSGDDVVDLRGPNEYYYARTLNYNYQYWTCDKDKDTSNFFIDAMSVIFGLDGLITIRDTYDTGEKDENGDPITTEVHPLAKLSALGKGLIESAIRSVTMAVISSGFAGLLSATQFGGAFTAASSMFVSIATIGLSIGFITYYILPFLPFIYFFFAVGNWVKSIFEAMVGAPLWALAHLRIDGDGIPGKMAVNGYLLIFEIFLRPILTIFGLLGGMAIFTALATILNEIFNIVVSVGVGINLDDDTQGMISMHVVDVFFFTVVYAVILYMMAVSSFKMINLVPNNILRWFGQSVAAFSDNEPDPTGNLTQYAAIGGAQIGGKLASGLTQGVHGIGAIPGAAIGLVTPSKGR